MTTRLATLDQMFNQLSEYMDYDEKSLKRYLMKHAVATKEYEGVKLKFPENKGFLYFMMRTQLTILLRDIQEEGEKNPNLRISESRQLVRDLGQLSYKEVKDVVKEEHEGLTKTFYYAIFQELNYRDKERARKNKK